ncbi:MAG TPA: proteinase inhibitor I4 serpin [Bacteroidetes bacterium]|nr:proteinase inhibitor I4 serpin [Bacteroidota bacterium]
MIAFFACNRKSQGGETDGKKLNENCYLKHDPGPCRMAIKRYYYDEKEKKCKEFLYGGCKGVVPFESLKACQKGCGCQ